MKFTELGGDSHHLNIMAIIEVMPDLTVPSGALTYPKSHFLQNFNTYIICSIISTTDRGPKLCGAITIGKF